MILLKPVTTVLLLILCTGSLIAQLNVNEHDYMRENHFTVDGYSGFNKENAVSLGYARFFHPGKTNQFKFGFGGRATAFIADKVINFTTAPPKYAGIINAFGDPEMIDTIRISRPVTNMLNLTFNIQYSPRPEMDIGFAIDILGYSFGNKRRALLVSSIREEDVEEIQPATVTDFNLWLPGNYSQGSLNSQFFYRYWLSKQFALQASLALMYIEYTTTGELTLENNRFRHINGFGALGFSISP